MATIKAGIRQLVISSADLSRDLRLDVAGSATMKTGTVMREALNGATGVVGRKESYEPAFCEAEVHIRDLTALAAIEGAEDITVIAVLASGQTAQITDAWLVSSPDADLVGGVTTLRFESGTPGYASAGGA